MFEGVPVNVSGPNETRTKSKRLWQKKKKVKGLRGSVFSVFP